MGILKFGSKDKHGNTCVRFAYINGNTGVLRSGDLVDCTIFKDKNEVFFQNQVRKKEDWKLEISKIIKVYQTDSLDGAPKKIPFHSKKFVVIQYEYAKYLQREIILGIVPASTGWKNFTSELSECAEKERCLTEIAPADTLQVTENQEKSLLHNLSEEDRKALAKEIASRITISFEYGGSKKNSSDGCRKTLRHLKTAGDYKRFQDFVVIDTETTGLDRNWDKIIEIALIKVKDGVVENELSMLINPEMNISPSASAVNGIFDKDVQKCPVIGSVIDQIMTFIGDNWLLGHNTNFDVGFLAKALEESGSIHDFEYVDTISMCKDVFPKLPNYKLETVMKHVGISEPQEHRALDDARRTLEVFVACKAEKIRQYDQEAKERKEAKKKAEQERKEKFGNYPLFNIGFAFTGEFSISRSEMIQLAESVGAVYKSSVSKNSKYLVKGDTSEYDVGPITSKMEKAQELISKGIEISIINEHEFFDLIEKNKP